MTDAYIPFQCFPVYTEINVLCAWKTSSDCLVAPLFFLRLMSENVWIIKRINKFLDNE